MVAKGWVLTATHCTPPLGSNSLFQVTLPNAQASPKAVVEYFPHSGYKPYPYLEEDIALLKVDEVPAGVPRVASNWVPDRTTPLYFMAWRGGRPSGGAVPLVPYTPDCLADEVKSHSHLWLDPNETICTASANGFEEADSGGPLFALVNGTWQLAGIISSFGSSKMADRSMSIAGYDDWIQETLASNGGFPAAAPASPASRVNHRRRRKPPS